jgi:hypothetical protein
LRYETLKNEIVRDFAEKCEDPKLVRMFANTFFSTLETTTELIGDETYVFTGDIPAMWLRDSSAQVKHYIQYAGKYEEFRRVITGLIRRQVCYILIDPYANAFNKDANGNGHKDKPVSSPWVWERKYEVDSLCYPIALSYEYWRTTDDISIFSKDYKRCVNQILDIWIKEQQHAKNSDYTFKRVNCERLDTLSNKGKGMPVNDTGMTWCGFRPSDDGCTFNYHIPSNMFAATVLKYIGTIADEIFKDEGLSNRARLLCEDISHGIETYGRCLHPTYGEIYAYETDGFGNHNLMDDANVPSLLSIPYLGYTSPENVIYQNTRKFVLSHDNPFYFEGKFAKGIGSPHTPEGYIWHIGLAMQGLTSKDKHEMKAMMDTLLSTDAETQQMHEGFNCDNPTEYTRPWFAWANSLFSEFAIKYIDECC